MAASDLSRTGGEMAILSGGIMFLCGLVFFLIGAIPLVIEASKGRPWLGGENLGSAIMGGTGLVLMLTGLGLVFGGRSRVRKRRALALRIYERGIPTEGTVTFVDKNYSLLVNQKPIYSIVEFKFRDGSGVERTSRKTDVESDLVIRLKIEVGSKVQVKFLYEDPEKNILMLPEPGRGR
jgi:hypothetical protein